MFWASQHPSSGALKTVTATSGIGHNTGTATSFQRGLLRTGVSYVHNYLNSTDQYIPQDSLTPVLSRPRWKEVAVPVL